MQFNDYDIYLCAKNSGPLPNKNVPHNKRVRLRYFELKTFSAYVKTYHVSPGIGCLGKKQHSLMDRTVLNQDIAPWCFYTCNKRKRWETLSEFGPDFIANLEKANDYMKIVVLERLFHHQISDPTLYKMPYFFDHTRIKSICWNENFPNDREAVSFQKRYSSGRGNNYLNFTKENREESEKRTVRRPGEVKRRRWIDIDWEKDEAEETLVAYNLITIPENFRKTSENKHCTRVFRWDWDWPHSFYWRRLERLYDVLQEIEYGLFEYYEEDDFQDEDFELNQNLRIDKYYNLMDHFVEKFHVVKKPRKLTRNKHQPVN